MRKMQVVIEIPEEIYNAIKDGWYDENCRKMAIAIGNGTPLPKEHGRLIDADEFDSRIRAAGGMAEEELTEDFKDGVLTVLDVLKMQKAVIEADKEVA